MPVLLDSRLMCSMSNNRKTEGLITYKSLGILSQPKIQGNDNTIMSNCCRLTPEMLLPETRASSPVEDKNKRTSTGSTNSTAAASAHQLVVKQLAASILQVHICIDR